MTNYDAEETSDNRRFFSSLSNAKKLIKFRLSQKFVAGSTEYSIQNNGTPKIDAHRRSVGHLYKGIGVCVCERTARMCR